ncbi:YezD family protein [Paenibacillus sepulcri]|uniref:YezD family protein n=1 Tax=Paenibacillus sepulcri TaxID=359917 RepID=A0ABS7C672_9BACL|nr:YezD family protein [Paenibacillus sepulcri]
MAKGLELDEVWIRQVEEQVNGLEYGSVQITVHDGRIVQIERTDRKRFENNTSGGVKKQSPRT